MARKLWRPGKQRAVDGVDRNPTIAELRRSYRENGLPEVSGDPDVRARLEDAEKLIATCLFRSDCIVDVLPAPTPGDGVLYLTDRRLMLHAAGTWADVPLGAVDELGLAPGRLLLALKDGDARSLQVAQPESLRLLVALAIADLNTLRAGNATSSPHRESR